MTKLELKKLICELLEAVPFEKQVDIYHDLKSKYSELEDYTFGVEFEFEPVVEELLSRDDIKTKLAHLYGSTNDNGLSRDYDSWLDEKRENALTRWTKRTNGEPSSLDDYDEEYGPMTEDDYKDHIPEPERSSFDSDEEYEEKHTEWEEKQNEVDNDYRRWNSRNRYDYQDEFIDSIVRSGNYDNYLADSELKRIDTEGSIVNAIDFIADLGEDVRYGDKSDSTTWAVGEDGSNIEIRSRHMRQSSQDFSLIQQVGNWVSDQTTGVNTGMHIHIGLPKDFDAFDLLAITTLVDEKAVQTALPYNRNFASYAKLRRSISNLFISKIRDKMRDERRDMIPKYFTLTNSEVLEIVKGFDRNHGTNIAAFSEHKTIEFRYLSTDIAYKINQWVDYFLLLPRIAKSRNKVILESIYDEQLVATRLPGKIKFTFFAAKRYREKVPMPTYPADMIKQQSANDWIKDLKRNKK